MSSTINFIGALTLRLVILLTLGLKLDNIKENTKKQAARKHHKSPTKKHVPLRTSTWISECIKEILTR